MREMPSDGEKNNLAPTTVTPSLAAPAVEKVAAPIIENKVQEQPTTPAAQEPVPLQPIKKVERPETPSVSNTAQKIEVPLVETPPYKAPETAIERPVPKVEEPAPAPAPVMRPVQPQSKPTHVPAPPPPPSSAPQTVVGSRGVGSISALPTTRNVPAGNVIKQPNPEPQPQPQAAQTTPTAKPTYTPPGISHTVQPTKNPVGSAFPTSATHQASKVTTPIRTSVAGIQNKATGQAAPAQSVATKPAGFPAVAKTQTPIPSVAHGGKAPQTQSPHQVRQPVSVPTKKDKYQPEGDDEMENMDAFKGNAQRQRSEQKSVNNILTTVVATVSLVFLTFFGLAAYGGYVLYGELGQQKITTAQMREDLLKQIRGTQDELAQTREALEKQGDQHRILISRMNLDWNAKMDAVQNKMATEKKLRDAESRMRAQEIRALRERLSQVENSPRSFR